MSVTIRLRFALAIATLATLAACSGGTEPTPSAATSIATTLPTAEDVNPVIEDVIELDGSEALGLAVTDDAVWAITYQSGTLSRIDPGSGTVSFSESLATGAATLLAVGDELWAAGYASQTESNIYRIDPVTGAVMATVASGEVCCDLTAGDGAIWAIDPGGSLLRIDPGGNEVVDRIDISIDRNAHTNVVFAGDSLWVSSDTTPLFRIDPNSDTVEEFDVGGGVPFLENDGLLWGAAPDVLWAVDPSTGVIAGQIGLEDSIEVISLGVAETEIWVGIRRPGFIGSVLRIDRTSGEVLDEFREIEIPARIAFGFDSVWITDSGSNELYRISPAG